MFAALVDEARMVVRWLLRLVILIIVFGLISWPFGGPFHLAHLLIGGAGDTGRQALTWAKDMVGAP